jgi:ubiquinone/menaquinone biosynthesis C-methylase UbiE
MKKLIYVPVREALKSAVYQVAAFLPTAFFGYIPYKRRSFSFVLPTSSAPSQEKLEFETLIPPTEGFFTFPGAERGKEEEYLSIGEKRVSKMLEVVEASGFSFIEGNRILEFGCGAGRLIRHLKDLSEICEIWGVDIDAPSIYWCKQHLAPSFHFATTTTIPHLPFEDRYFDFIYCGSVFTHIDDLTEAWLLELRRVLSPNGRLYITIQDKQSIETLTESNKDYCKSLKKGIDLYNKVKGDFAMLVFDRNTGNTDTFYDLDYFCKILGSTKYQVLSVTKEAFAHQTAVLVKRHDNSEDVVEELMRITQSDNESNLLNA